MSDSKPSVAITAEGPEALLLLPLLMLAPFVPVLAAVEPEAEMELEL